jgi:hypothetical protein
VRAHAADCPRCGPRLAREDATHRRLELLKTDVPEVDVVGPVLDQIGVEAAEEPGR